MGHPERDAWKIGVDVAAGVDLRVSREIEGHSAGFAWQCLDYYTGKTIAARHIETEDSKEPSTTLKGPETDDAFEPGQLRKTVDI